jgi:hypothetical protein
MHLGPAGYISVISGDDSNDIDSLAFQFGVFFNEGREMFDLTSRCKCTWDSKQNNLLPLEFLPLEEKKLFVKVGREGEKPFERQALELCRKR